MTISKIPTTPRGGKGGDLSISIPSSAAGAHPGGLLRSSAVLLEPAITGSGTPRTIPSTPRVIGTGGLQPNMPRGTAYLPNISEVNQQQANQPGGSRQAQNPMTIPKDASSAPPKGYLIRQEKQPNFATPKAPNYAPVEGGPVASTPRGFLKRSNPHKMDWDYLPLRIPTPRSAVPRPTIISGPTVKTHHVPTLSLAFDSIGPDMHLENRLIKTVNMSPEQRRELTPDGMTAAITGNGKVIGTEPRIIGTFGSTNVSAKGAQSVGNITATEAPYPRATLMLSQVLGEKNTYPRATLMLSQVLGEKNTNGFGNTVNVTELGDGTTGAAEGLVGLSGGMASTIGSEKAKGTSGMSGMAEGMSGLAGATNDAGQTASSPDGRRPDVKRRTPTVMNPHIRIGPGIIGTRTELTGIRTADHIPKTDPKMGGFEIRPKTDLHAGFNSYSGYRAWDDAWNTLGNVPQAGHEPVYSNLETLDKHNKEKDSYVADFAHLPGFQPGAGGGPPGRASGSDSGAIRTRGFGRSSGVAMRTSMRQSTAAGGTCAAPTSSSPMRSSIRQSSAARASTRGPRSKNRVSIAVGDGVPGTDGKTSGSEPAKPVIPIAYLVASPKGNPRMVYEVPPTEITEGRASSHPGASSHHGSSPVGTPRIAHGMMSPGMMSPLGPPGVMSTSLTSVGSPQGIPRTSSATGVRVTAQGGSSPPQSACVQKPGTPLYHVIAVGEKSKPQRLPSPKSELSAKEKDTLQEKAIKRASLKEQERDSFHKVGASVSFKATQDTKEQTSSMLEIIGGGGSPSSSARASPQPSPSASPKSGSATAVSPESAVSTVQSPKFGAATAMETGGKVGFVEIVTVPVTPRAGATPRSGGTPRAGVTPKSSKTPLRAQKTIVPNVGEPGTKQHILGKEFLQQATIADITESIPRRKSCTFGAAVHYTPGADPPGPYNALFNAPPIPGMSLQGSNDIAGMGPQKFGIGSYNLPNNPDGNFGLKHYVTSAIKILDQGDGSRTKIDFSNFNVNASKRGTMSGQRILSPTSSVATGGRGNTPKTFEVYDPESPTGTSRSVSPILSRAASVKSIESHRSSSKNGENGPRVRSADGRRDGRTGFSKERKPKDGGLRAGSWQDASRCSKSKKVKDDGTVAGLVKSLDYEAREVARKANGPAPRFRSSSYDSRKGNMGFKKPVKPLDVSAIASIQKVDKGTKTPPPGVIKYLKGDKAGTTSADDDTRSSKSTRGRESVSNQGSAGILTKQDSQGVLSSKQGSNASLVRSGTSVLDSKSQQGVVLISGTDIESRVGEPRALKKGGIQKSGSKSDLCDKKSKRASSRVSTRSPEVRPIPANETTDPNGGDPTQTTDPDAASKGVNADGSKFDFRKTRSYSPPRYRSPAMHSPKNRTPRGIATGTFPDDLEMGKRIPGTNRMSFASSTTNLGRPRHEEETFGNEYWRGARARNEARSWTPDMKHQSRTAAIMGRIFDPRESLPFGEGTGRILPVGDGTDNVEGTFEMSFDDGRSNGGRSNASSKGSKKSKGSTKSLGGSKNGSRTNSEDRDKKRVSLHIGNLDPKAMNSLNRGRTSFLAKIFDDTGDKMRNLDYDEVGPIGPVVALKGPSCYYNITATRVHEGTIRSEPSDACIKNRHWASYKREPAPSDDEIKEQGYVSSTTVLHLQSEANRLTSEAQGLQNQATQLKTQAAIADPAATQGKELLSQAGQLQKEAAVLISEAGKIQAQVTELQAAEEVQSSQPKAQGQMLSQKKQMRSEKDQMVTQKGPMRSQKSSTGGQSLKNVNGNGFGNTNFGNSLNNVKMSANIGASMAKQSISPAVNRQSVAAGIVNLDGVVDTADNAYLEMHENSNFKTEVPPIDMRENSPTIHSRIAHSGNNPSCDKEFTGSASPNILRHIAALPIRQPKEVENIFQSISGSEVIVNAQTTTHFPNSPRLRQSPVRERTGRMDRSWNHILGTKIKGQLQHLYPKGIEKLMKSDAVHEKIAPGLGKDKHWRKLTKEGEEDEEGAKRLEYEGRKYGRCGAKVVPPDPNPEHPPPCVLYPKRTQSPDPPKRVRPAYTKQPFPPEKSYLEAEEETGQDFNKRTRFGWDMNRKQVQAQTNYSVFKPDGEGRELNTYWERERAESKRVKQIEKFEALQKKIQIWNDIEIQINNKRAERGLGPRPKPSSITQEALIRGSDLEKKVEESSDSMIRNGILNEAGEFVESARPPYGKEEFAVSKEHIRFMKTYGPRIELPRWNYSDEGTQTKGKRAVPPWKFDAAKASSDFWRGKDSRFVSGPLEKRKGRGGYFGVVPIIADPLHTFQIERMERRYNSQSEFPKRSISPSINGGREYPTDLQDKAIGERCITAVEGASNAMLGGERTNHIAGECAMRAEEIQRGVSTDGKGLEIHEAKD